VISLEWIVLVLALAVMSAAFADRRVYTRADLDELKRLDRRGVFAALGSFDGRDMDDEAFVLAAAVLLDGRRVPGLAAARQRSDAAAVLDALVSAVRSAAIAPETDAKLSRGQRAVADGALEHRFGFYDEWHRLDDDIDWDHNPGTKHWSMDLNRFTYLGPLTCAYHAAKDPRYARKAVGLILDWIDKADWSRCFAGTPYMFGSYLNEAIHCPAWARCVRSLTAADQVGPLELMRIAKSLHDQLAYLEIVTGGHHGNWPTIGFGGMLGTLAALPVYRDTDRFIDHCIDGFALQIDDQILPDGVQDELTPHYHRVVVSNLVNAAVDLAAFGRELHPRTMATLRKMVRYMQQTTMPDGSGQVAFNDSDPDVTGAAILKRLQTASMADAIAPEPDLGSELFAYAGVAILRQRPGEGDLYLAFDGGPYGRSHQHEDMLGFELFAFGRRFIGDPGRHLYDWSDTSFLPHLRTTKAHSTICIDGEGQNAFGRRDTWIPKHPVEVAWSAGDHEIRAAASYTLGYGHGNAIQVAHRREIVFVDKRFWVVFDRVTGHGEHRIESRFQFTPGPLAWDGVGAKTAFKEANLLLVPLASEPFDEVQIVEGRRDPKDGWYSCHYGRIEPAPAFVLHARAVLPWTCATLLWPYTGAVAPELTTTTVDDVFVVRGERIGEFRIAPH